MIFYHGTTLDAAKQIAKVGLIPHRESAYRLRDPRDGTILRKLPGEDKPYIYLQERSDIAEDYARFRAQYERAKQGELIDTGDNSQLAVMQKTSRKRNPDAQPALVTLDVPRTIAEKFQMDPQNWTGGNVCLCTIPPQYVRGIREVR